MGKVLNISTGPGQVEQVRKRSGNMHEGMCDGLGILPDIFCFLAVFPSFLYQFPNFLTDFIIIIYLGLDESTYKFSCP